MQIGVHLELESNSATLDLWDYNKPLLILQARISQF